MVERLSASLKNKYETLQAEIKAKNKILIAYSGGVDSALLAKIAFDVLVDRAWAVLVDSETVPEFELNSAREQASAIGINFNVIQISQLKDNKFIQNDMNRCYFCRKSMARTLARYAHEKGIRTIAAGAHSSDLDDYRPGIKAFQEAKIWHPFIELRFTKPEVRALAKYLGLSIFRKPSMACLSSRIPYGQKITAEALSMIGRAEDYLRQLGFSQYRARTHDKLIRIEIDLDELDKLLANRTHIIEKMKEIGYTYVSLDLEGFRSGSMNEVITKKK